METGSKIYVAGHNGLVGSALVRKLKESGYSNIVNRSKHELDLTNKVEVFDFFQTERPEYVFLAAAKVGGIMANKTYPADFIRDNLLIETNVIDAAHQNKVAKLLFLGSSCIYPKYAEQPIKEESLLTGALEPTNEAYAVAKIAGIKLCQSYNQQFGDNFISVMPTNLYGQNDNFDLETSHVLPALIGRLHRAKNSGVSSVTVWGSGSPMREFLHVDDLADACIHLMNTYDSPEIINIGTGEDITIRDLVSIIKSVIDFTGNIEWDTSKPDGTPRKQLDVAKIHNLGWHHSIELEDGIRMTYEWYRKHISQ